MDLETVHTDTVFHLNTRENKTPCLLLTTWHMSTAWLPWTLRDMTGRTFYRRIIDRIFDLRRYLIPTHTAIEKRNTHNNADSCSMGEGFADREYDVDSIPVVMAGPGWAWRPEVGISKIITFNITCTCIQYIACKLQTARSTTYIFPLRRPGR